MEIDRQYWENFYKENGAITDPSPFALSVMNGHVAPGQRLAELGCGNGRDSVFFAEQGLSVLAIDQCEEEIEALAEAVKLDGLEFRSGDFTALEPMDAFDAIYSRFTLHSVSESGENATIAWAHASLAEGGLLLIEARGQKNELFDVGEAVPEEPDAFVHDGHYRRFINFDALQEKLMTQGFTVLSAEEKAGFAPYQGEDQIFIRIAARKNSV